MPKTIRITRENSDETETRVTAYRLMDYQVRRLKNCTAFALFSSDSEAMHQEPCTLSLPSEYNPYMYVYIKKEQVPDCMQHLMEQALSYVENNSNQLTLTLRVVNALRRYADARHMKTELASVNGSVLEIKGLTAAVVRTLLIMIPLILLTMAMIGMIGIAPLLPTLVATLFMVSIIFLGALTILISFCMEWKSCQVASVRLVSPTEERRSTIFNQIETQLQNLVESTEVTLPVVAETDELANVAASNFPPLVNCAENPSHYTFPFFLSQQIFPNEESSSLLRSTI